MLRAKANTLPSEELDESLLNADAAAPLEDMKRFGDEARKLPEVERKAYWNRLSDEGRLGENRIWLGNSGEKGSVLQLKDAKGRTRLMLQVTADGKAKIQMLDEQGKVTMSIGA